MSGRETVLARVRAALGAGGSDAARRAAVAERLAETPRGVIPARGRLPDKARVALFCALSEKAGATVERVAKHQDVPKSVAAYLRARNLPACVRMGNDMRLRSMPWDKQRSLEVKRGPSDGDDEAGVSFAGAGIAETGTLVLLSGADNPTSVNFLPEHHIVVITAEDIQPEMESVLSMLRLRYGRGEMPRTVNFITGPSRSGDIEQTLLMGAHGPRAVHIILVGGPD